MEVRKKALRFEKVWSSRGGVGRKGAIRTARGGDPPHLGREKRGNGVDEEGVTLLHEIKGRIDFVSVEGPAEKIHVGEGKHKLTVGGVL